MTITIYQRDSPVLAPLRPLSPRRFPRLPWQEHRRPLPVLDVRLAEPQFQFALLVDLCKEDPAGRYAGRQPHQKPDRTALQAHRREPAHTAQTHWVSGPAVHPIGGQSAGELDGERRPQATRQARFTTVSAAAAPVATTSAPAACLSHGVWMTGSASRRRKAGKIPMPSAAPTA